MHNTFRRTALAAIAVPLLAAPSAYGVYRYLAPESGPIASASAAIGFELLYLGVNLLVLRSAELRAYARRVALSAVITAVSFNALAHYADKVPHAFDGAPFAPLPAALALITALPLAGLAYAVSVLLHRLSEERYALDALDALGSAHAAPAAAPGDAAAAAHAALGAMRSASAGVRYALGDAPADARYALGDARYAPSDAPAALGDAPADLRSAPERTLSLPVRSSASDAQWSCPRCGGAISQQQSAAATRWGPRWRGCATCAGRTP